MLTYSFENRGSQTIYEYLYEQIKSDILSGTLAPDTKLPSKRSFAKQLGISTITVENAYAQLIAEGYIYSIPKSGFYVGSLAIPYPYANVNFKKNQHIKQEESVENQTSCIEYFADFASNATNSSNFPFSTWAKLMRETISENQINLMQKSPVGGVGPLKEAITNYLYAFRGLQINPEQIVIGAGTEYLYGLLIQLMGYDKSYAIEDPGYQKLSHIYHANQVDVKYIPVDNDGIRISALCESGADILHISPSHHFPTGIITPISKRIQLLEWANASTSRYIIEDDYDSEFRMSGKPVPTLSSIDQNEKVIYMNTFSKSLSQTIRISYMILPKKLSQIFLEKFGFYSCTVSTFEQYTLAKFINRGYFEKHINRMRNQYRATRDILLETLKKQGTDQVKISEEHAGLHFLLQVKTSLSDESLMKKAAKKGVRISCLSQFYHNPEEAPANILVINYSGIDPNTLSEATKVILSCL